MWPALSKVWTESENYYVQLHVYAPYTHIDVQYVNMHNYSVGCLCCGKCMVQCNYYAGGGREGGKE